ncbi:hypothetical protein RN001_009078 [Aquatica leii]|uniref:Uncharacterized protein n=1 Tax=Aquatica leii TaxID=1421715 RepID=A0AAN7SDM0_9COLE|nr:hypothetical protein RN001_009078 [Aquatica leii]
MWMLFLWALSFIGDVLCVVGDDSSTIDFSSDHVAPRQNEKYSLPVYPYMRGNGNNLGTEYQDDRMSDFTHRCSERLENALEKIRRRELHKQRSVDLHGYSLHHQMRNAPYDMYVTEMRVRVPSKTSWVRVDRCRFEPRNSSLETRLLFNDLTISGRVNLFNEGELKREPVNPSPEDSCNMILRLRRAGIGFNTEPIRAERGQFNVRTDSYFVEPGFISVYAYGCGPRMKQHRRSFRDDEDDEDDDDDVSKEMEDVFLKGIRSLLTTYMQKELQPAIKETLMTNLGYTVSYG